MSQRLGLGPNAWALYEREGRLPKYETLHKLGEMGFSLDWIVTGRGTMRFGEAMSDDTAIHADDDRADALLGPAEEILRNRPPVRAEIPSHIEESIESLRVFMRAGPKSYPVALVISRHISEQIEDEINKY
jgi:hypothetical protein